MNNLLVYLLKNEAANFKLQSKKLITTNTYVCNNMEL